MNDDTDYLVGIIIHNSRLIGRFLWTHNRLYGRFIFNNAGNKAGTEEFSMLLGLPDPSIAFCFIALFVSAAFGLYYGIRNWNKGE